ncbi:MAG: hypothetical protein O7H39_16365, partial [Gammaproteobacteria bacterium]|nr:hypothetical protein [Gammaproteobacteria bacterium]
AARVINDIRDIDNTAQSSKLLIRSRLLIRGSRLLIHGKKWINSGSEVNVFISEEPLIEYTFIFMTPCSDFSSLVTSDSILNPAPC